MQNLIQHDRIITSITGRGNGNGGSSGSDDLNSETPDRELLDDFLLSEINSINDAVNGLIQTNSLISSGYFVFAWILIERLNAYLTSVAPNKAYALVTSAFIYFSISGFFYSITNNYMDGSYLCSNDK
jgi:hypothetical protein